MVSGAFSLLLQDEPNLTPNQVKYRFKATANRNWADYNTVTAGAGYPDAHAAVHGTTIQSANVWVPPHRLLARMAILAVYVTQNGLPHDWSSVNWDSMNLDSVNRDSVNWDSVNWDSVSWDSINWHSVNRDSVNWDSVNWDSVNWNSVHWDSDYWGS